MGICFRKQNVRFMGRGCPLATYRPCQVMETSQEISEEEKGRTAKTGNTDHV